MIAYLFIPLLAVIVALGGVAAYFRGEAAQVKPLQTALTAAHTAMDEQGKAIDAMDRLRAITDGLYAEATAERADNVKVITVYRKVQSEQAKTNPELAAWGAARVPDAAIERLRQHDARYSEGARGTQNPGQLSGPDARPASAADRRKQ